MEKFYEPKKIKQKETEKGKCSVKGSHFSIIFTQAFNFKSILTKFGVPFYASLKRLVEGASIINIIIYLVLLASVITILC